MGLMWVCPLRIWENLSLSHMIAHLKLPWGYTNIHLFNTESLHFQQMICLIVLLLLYKVKSSLHSVLFGLRPQYPVIISELCHHFEKVTWKWFRWNRYICSRMQRSTLRVRTLLPTVDLTGSLLFKHVCGTTKNFRINCYVMMINAVKQVLVGRSFNFF